ncbi:uncharacterized protein K444DRAFT_620330 [Hyaloscypha bicolor E]|uniref:Uncharacterized protein n=1 Tax=Hyaloscypha bicolor E TaxID=1095630 RepID=A0A2J6SK72_9HELO|nr:uncharacterized protein K444DRAFT_620330 [Hyaloscypha bicolor E]PMD51179.1 hypothetical protein K444DRAFT_620330 [Hyaloscypha bicolor E]
MVSFTTFASVISMALFASAAPAVMEARGPPPPTWSALDFALFKADAGQEYQCYNNVADLHVPPTDLGNCHTAPTFYNARIWDQAWGYTCKLEVYGNGACNDPPVGTILPNDFSYPCKFPGGSLVALNSWKATCTW